MKIRLRLTLWYSALLFLILTTFSITVYISLGRSLFVSLDHQLQREAAEVLGNLKFENSDSSDKVTDEVEIELEYSPGEGIFWRILDTRGNPLVGSGHLEDIAFSHTNSIETGYIQLQNIILADRTPIRLYTVPFAIENEGAGILQIAESYAHIQEVQSQLILLFVIVIPLTLVAASAGGWFLAANALDSIDRITRTVQQINADDLNQRLNFKLPDDEVGRLAATFDDMLSRLEAAFERQKRFIADASHEMRTPLAILKGDVEVALNRPRQVEEYQKTLEMVNETTDRLIALVQELFLLARADNNQLPLQVERFNLVELLTGEINNLKSQAYKKNIMIALEMPVELPITADPAKLRRLFINLIDNAIKYSNPGGEINISATVRGEQACVAIADTGSGISADHLPHLFDRFYRVDKARSRHMSSANGSGFGLGLSIAQWLVQAHRGRIEVTSRVGYGSTFTVWLPLEPPIMSQNPS
jgi:heavy metal sensor kinase